MDNLVELTVGQAIQLFYKFSLTALPVVNDHSQLVGTLEKSDAVSLGTLRQRLEDKLGAHLERLMIPAGSAIEPRLKRLLFERSRTVPVLTRDGRLACYWHAGHETLDAEFPLPYRELLFSLMDSLQRPAAIVFQEPKVGEAASGAFLRRLGLTRDRLRTWFSEMHWQGGAQDTGLSFWKDPDDLNVMLIRTPVKIRDQFFGWLLELKEEYEIAGELISAESSARSDGSSPAVSAGLRKKMGAQALRRVVQAYESYLLKKGMARSSGDVRRMTGLLGISRQSLRYKLKKHRMAGKRKNT